MPTERILRRYRHVINAGYQQKLCDATNGSSGKRGVLLNLDSAIMQKD